MIEGLKVTISGKELKQIIKTKIGWNQDQIIKNNQRKIQVAGGGEFAMKEEQIKRDTRQLQFLAEHIVEEETYQLLLPEVTALGIGSDMLDPKSASLN
jgi:hypothetical protein